MVRAKRIVKGDTVQLNLSKSSLTEQQKMFLEEMEHYYKKNGIGDGTVHNTLLFILGRTLNMPDFNPFSEAETTGEFILHIPAELNAEIDKFAEAWGIRKLDAVPTILDLAMKKELKRNADTGKRRATEPNLVDVNNLMSMSEFCATKKGKPLSLPTLREAEKEGKIKFVTIGQPSKFNKFVDTSKYYIDDNGKIAEYK